jgi:hypothetical protein
MRKLLVAFAALMVASSPVLAKVKKKAAPPPAPMSQNEASWRLMKESVPLFLPTAVSAAYLSTHSDDAKQDAKPKKH